MNTTSPSSSCDSLNTASLYQTIGAGASLMVGTAVIAGRRWMRQHPPTPELAADRVALIPSAAHDRPHWGKIAVVSGIMGTLLCGMGALTLALCSNRK